MKKGGARKKSAPIDRRPRAGQVVRALRREYPEAKCSLDFATPFQLLIATILSAQCTDERVNKVTPALFAKYPDAAAMAGAEPADLERLVASTNFYKNKARAMLETSRALVERHGGGVPEDLEALVALRGVGRKTANVVLGNAFGKPGLVVDTHVGRLVRRLGLTVETDPVKVETELMRWFEEGDWTDLAHLLIYHGRAVCSARVAKCEGCVIASLCEKRI